MQEIRCVIVDDEPFARKGIRAYIEKIAFLKLVGECEDAMELNHFLKSEKVDLIFLDIEMPELSGLDFIATLSHPPKIIIISAYEKYALRGYELEVMDYLLKPVSFERFFKAANRAFDTMCASVAEMSMAHKSLDEAHIFIKVDKQLKKMFFKDILFIQGMGNYIVVHSVDSQDITFSTLQQISALLPASVFVACHRSYIVNMNKIVAIDGNQLLVDKYKLPIARNLKEKVLGLILGQ